MENSLIGLYFAALCVVILIKTKPSFFWEHHKIRKARQELGDEMTEWLMYGFLAFIVILFTVGVLLEG